MRNLKRALSLALASVMLLGMMVVGTSAAFADADEIVNTEAVEITAGLGLFAGSDGKFNPKGNVTRAQMATVIVKMLYGSEINADQYKGINKFSDVAAFEGGWAEGYINLCANLGIVGGYGDGTYKPGNSVTTAEAVTMIINALGVDAGKGEWPLTVMAKAEEMELFAELAVKPGTNIALTRDQLASIVLEGIQYSPAGVDGYSVTVGNKTFEFDNISDALAAAGNDLDKITEIVGEDTLWKTVFEVKEVTDYITANQATGEKFTTVGDVDVALETGLDQLGHKVTVYFKDEYKNEKNPGTAYCIVEEADYVVVKEDIEDKKDYAAAFDAKYDLAETVVTFDDGGNKADAEFNYVKGEAATAGTYAIDKETGKIITYLAPIAVSIDQVSRITTTAGKETIRLTGDLLQNNEDEDEVVEYDGIAKDDVVAVKVLKNTVTYLEKVEVVSGKITKTGKIGEDDATFIDGTGYVNGAFTVAGGIGLTTSEYEPSTTTTYDAYLYGGKLIGVKATSAAAMLTDVIYVVDTYTVAGSSAYGDGPDHYYAQGVNAAGEEVSVLIGIAGCIDNVDSTTETEVTAESFKAIEEIEEEEVATGLNKFYTFTKSKDKEQSKKNIMVGKAADAFVDYNPDEDDFFAAVGTNDAIGKDTKYIAFGERDRAYLTADTKFIVVEQNANTDELEIATYTGIINKTIGEGDVLSVAAAKNAEGNVMAKIVVISAAELELNCEDYVVITAAKAAQAGTLDTNVFEVEAYFTAENKYVTIKADTTEAAIYSSYTINEDGIYELTGAIEEAEGRGSYVELGEVVEGIIGTSINTTELDLADASEAVIVDVRSEDTLDKSSIPVVEALEDIKVLLADKTTEYQVELTVVGDFTDADEQVITHIFVESIKTLDEDCQGDVVADSWKEEGTNVVVHDTDIVNNEDGTHSEICSDCDKVFSTEDCEYVEGVCECGAVEPVEEPEEPVEE